MIYYELDNNIMNAMYYMFGFLYVHLKVSDMCIVPAKEQEKGRSVGLKKPRPLLLVIFIQIFFLINMKNF